jgi:hypothetical protein
MRQVLYLLGIWVLIGGLAFAATVTKGKTFTTNEEVTAAKLHQLVDSATVSAIDQSDVATNYGFVIKSSSQPSDTDALWNDTGTDACLKAYVSGAYEEVGSSPASINTGAVTSTSLNTADATLSGYLSLVGNINLAGSILSDSRVAPMLYANNLTTSGALKTDSVVSSQNVTICYGWRTVGGEASATVTGLPFTSATTYIVLCTMNEDNTTNRYNMKADRNSGSQITIYNPTNASLTTFWIAIGV